MANSKSSQTDAHRLVWVCLIPALFVVPLIFMPLGRDNGWWAYLGQSLLDGGLPCRDIFDLKGPPMHWTVALSLWLFGATEPGIRFALFLVVVAGSGLAAWLGGLLMGPRARLPSALCYVLAVAHLRPNSPCIVGQAEDWVLLLQLVAVLIMAPLHSFSSPRRIAVAAALLGLSCLYKPTAVVPSTVFTGFLIYFQVRKSELPARLVIRPFALATCAFFVPALVCAVYLHVMGIFDEFWDQVIVCSTSYASKRENGVHLLAPFMWPDWLRLTVAASVMVLPSGPLWRRKETVWIGGQLVALLLGNYLAVVLQGKIYLFHWTPVLGVMAILAGCAVARLVGYLLRQSSRFGLLNSSVLITACLLIAVAQPWFYIKATGTLIAGAVSQTSLEHYQSLFITGELTPAAHKRVARYVRERTSVDEKIMVWGYESVIYVLADRRCPSRFPVDRIFYLPVPARREAWRAELVEDLKVTPPAFFLLVEKKGHRLWQQRDSQTEFRDFVQLSQFIDENYLEQDRIDNVRIFQHRKHASATMPQESPDERVTLGKTHPHWFFEK